MKSKEARIHSVADRFLKPSQYYQVDRKELLDLMPKDAFRVLDVGCGAGESWVGYEGEVHGLEYDPASADIARKHLASVVVGDVQKVELPWAEGYFDCIVFADVLEHLYDPWGTLLRLRRYLKPSGTVLVSLPNVRYYKVLRGLIFDSNFAYTRYGVLDIDHVRFFARKDVEWMLEQTGIRAESWGGIQGGSATYRFANRLLLGSLDDFLTRQFLVRASLIPGFTPPQNKSEAPLDSKGAD